MARVGADRRNTIESIVPGSEGVSSVGHFNDVVLTVAVGRGDSALQRRHVDNVEGGGARWLLAEEQQRGSNQAAK